MWDSKKRITAIMSAMTLTLASVGALPLSASAEENTTAVFASETETGKAAGGESDDFDKMMDMFGEAIENQNNTDNFEDSDTKGNASLIKEEDIIYESEKMQFISVTTKDGDVFYILINYSAEDVEDNVYFLNKVDDFDLYSLLYADDEDSDKSVDSAEQASLYADAASNGHSKNPEATESESSEETSTENEAQPAKHGPMNNSILIVGGIAILGVIAFVIFMIKTGKLGGKKKKMEEPDDFEEDDYQDYGETEDRDE